jgi:hypothetical protein
MSTGTVLVPTRQSTTEELRQDSAQLLLELLEMRQQAGYWKAQFQRSKERETPSRPATRQSLAEAAKPPSLDPPKTIPAGLFLSRQLGHHHRAPGTQAHPQGMLRDLRLDPGTAGQVSLLPDQLPADRRLGHPQHHVATGPQPQQEFALPQLGRLRLELVTRQRSALWNEYIDRYHYLGYTPLVGAQLRYWVYTEDRLLALFGYGASAWRLAPRDRWIGWNDAQRQADLPHVVRQVRFLTLPWIRCPHLASKLLSLSAANRPL